MTASAKAIVHRVWIRHRIWIRPVIAAGPASLGCPLSATARHCYSPPNQRPRLRRATWAMVSALWDTRTRPARLASFQSSRL